MYEYLDSIKLDHYSSTGTTRDVLSFVCLEGGLGGRDRRTFFILSQPHIVTLSPSPSALTITHLQVSGGWSERKGKSKVGGDATRPQVFWTMFMNMLV